MPLPSSRDTNYSFGVTPVAAKDLNSIQDCIIALDGLLTGRAQGVYDGVTLAGGLSVAGAVNAGGPITADAGLTAGANQDIKLAGTGALKHDTWTRLIVPNPNGPTFTTTFASMNVSVQNATVQLDQHFLIGDIITAIRIAVTDNAIGPTKLNATLRRFANGSGSPITVATSNTSSGLGTLQILSMTGLSETISSGFAHQVAVLFALSNNGAVVWTVEVDYTR